MTLPYLFKFLRLAQESAKPLTPTQKEAAMYCRFLIPRTFRVADLVFDRAEDIRKLRSFDLIDDQTGLMLLDGNDNLRMFTASLKPEEDVRTAAFKSVCLDAVIPLFSRKSTARQNVKNLFWDDKHELLYVITDKHIQQVPYRALCGSLLMSKCSSSFLCRRYYKLDSNQMYCGKRQASNNYITDNCIAGQKKLSWPLSSTRKAFWSELFTCDKNKKACLSRYEHDDSSTKENELVCPEEFCMCRVSIICSLKIFLLIS